MLVMLKIIHFAALLAGGAAAITPGVLMRALAKVGHAGPPPAQDAMTLRTLGVTGLAAIAVLWISGLLMVLIAYGPGGLGPIFGLKLVAAAVVLSGAAWLNLAAARAARTGTPPDPVLRDRVAMAMRGALAIAIVCAVIVFN